MEKLFSFLFCKSPGCGFCNVRHGDGWNAFENNNLGGTDTDPTEEELVNKVQSMVEESPSMTSSAERPEGGKSGIDEKSAKTVLPQERNQAKQKLQRLVRDFANECVMTGVPVSASRPGEALPSRYTMRIDRSLRSLMLCREETDQTVVEVQLAEIRKITKHEGDKLQLTILYGEEEPEQVCAKKEQWLLFDFPITDECDRFYNCICVLRMAVGNLQNEDSESRFSSKSL